MNYQQEIDDRRRDMVSYPSDQAPGVKAGVLLGILALLALSAMVLAYRGEPPNTRTTQNMTPTTEQMPSTPPATPLDLPN